MIIATDVQYNDQADTALAAAVAFRSWGDAAPAHEWAVPLSGLSEYVPGQFYKRELPCLQALLAASPVRPRTIIVDGHVWLGRGQPGLGKYLYDDLRELVPVVGIAKRPFHKGCAFPLFRGGSLNPLHVTVAGMHQATLEGYLCQLHGPHRIPTLLKRVDHLCRGLVQPV
jgi:deoxyribonuclease V